MKKEVEARKVKVFKKGPSIIRFGPLITRAGASQAITVSEVDDMCRTVCKLCATMPYMNLCPPVGLPNIHFRCGASGAS